ncbi:hypothetical protein KV102_15675 [Mumia sp. zg.B53]|uniref:DUF6069 family protein n=1 Tax=unclassified Mumia TaxID=2621872 RepID=UPI001C6E1EA0|nr:MULTISPECIES: DUF6069 family protein [unclassified Mumia]MBW9205680.1 hypothetical protein [Mumia sp. zg.B17]MBW9208318.1 hypothetical protein [Mumia sp. zg.B21]MBW9216276.1 hypothetical protein [Mumia sp. zg.B53]MDD9347569.1 DUF6069 family protein [Mumia sp.]
MSYQQPPQNDPRRVPQPAADADSETPSGLTVNTGRLWAGGVATAVVAGLAAVVGLLVFRGVFDIAVLVPSGGGRWDVVSTIPFALVAAGGALLATALMHLLVLATPRPRLFFGWIMVLVGVIAGVLPFTINVETSEQVASAVVGVLIVVVIASLVSSTADRAVTVAPPAY